MQNIFQKQNDQHFYEFIIVSFILQMMQLDLDIYFVTVGNRSIVIHQPNRGAGRFDCANIVPLFV